MNRLRIWVAKPEQGTKLSCKRARNRGIGAGLGSKSCQFSQKRKLRSACLLAITWDLLYPSHLHARTIRPNEVESPQVQKSGIIFDSQSLLLVSYDRVSSGNGLRSVVPSHSNQDNEVGTRKAAKFCRVEA